MNTGYSCGCCSRKLREALTRNYCVREAQAILRSCYGECERNGTKKTARLPEAVRARERLEAR